MKDRISHFVSSHAFHVFIGIVVALAVIGYAVYDHITLSKHLLETQEDLTFTTESLGNKITELETIISSTTAEKNMLDNELHAERDRNDEFENQIGKISGTVGTLEKLSKTDSELLQKYSKIFFLNEHYVPARLATINSTYIFDENKTLQIHADVDRFLESLLKNSHDDGMKLEVISAYRSFGTQASLKSSYKVTYGAGTANQFSADQGYSEHQLGTTVDFTTPAIGASFIGFENTDSYKWLVDNAYKYGFIMSYPKENKYYQYEPWHWRFVGVALAKKLHSDNTYFYSLDQRAINEYLVNIFD